MNIIAISLLLVISQCGLMGGWTSFSTANGTELTSGQQETVAKLTDYIKNNS